MNTQAGLVMNATMKDEDSAPKRVYLHGSQFASIDDSELWGICASGIAPWKRLAKSWLFSASTLIESFHFIAAEFLSGAPP